jgi:DNA mismatch repair protein MutS2
MHEAWLDKAFAHLEWPRLAQAALSRCRGESARRRGLELAADRERAALLLRETGEMLALLERGEQLPIGDLRDVDEHLGRVERQGTLKPAALADVLYTLQNARVLRGFLSAQRAHMPALFAACSTDPSLDALEAQLRDALDPDGTLSDRASPELRSLRTEIANLRERIVGRLSELIDRFEDVLSDRYYTLREGRYVIPVRRDAHERVPGIVHATSDSGASIFVEPRAVVAHGNRLKMAESELEREEERVLVALCELVREHLPSLRAAAEAIDRVDLRHAGALLGRELQGCVPELCGDAAPNEVALRAARHPLLMLAGGETVANDVELRAGQGLVISGPNASGKTVVLKTLGLSALMVRHGLPIAAAPGSRIGFFDRVLTDVGDEQSTAKNLSTFSAHITNLAEILRTADARSLVLLDELATGTDPEEGAALACAIVETLCERGAALAVSTHYEPLKALSLRDPRLRSASVGFDIERMEPTFKLTMDVPGASSALVVARRFGIDAGVIARAERVLPEQARRFEELVRELAARSADAAEERAALQGERAKLSALRAEEQARLTALKQKGDASIAREIAEVVQEVKSARAELARARERAKAAGATTRKQELADLGRSIDQVAARVAIGGDLAPAASAAPVPGAGQAALPEAAIAPGARVHVARLRSDAVVVEGPTKGRVRVAVGPLKLWVESGELLAAAPAAPVPTAPVLARAEAPKGRTRENTVDVKGLRVDDALSLVETFVDRLYTTDSRVGYVLHGHGTGALRDAVRKHLKTAVPHVRDAGPADASEGGDALTVFYLA